jgi:hypothetical protein
MKDQKTGLRVDWGHLALLFVFCGVTVAYLLDARATSLKTNNLLLVQPGALLLLILAAAVLPQCFRRGAPPAGDRPAPSKATFEERRARRLELGKVAALAAAFGAYVRKSSRRISLRFWRTALPIPFRPTFRRTIPSACRSARCRSCSASFRATRTS